MYISNELEKNNSDIDVPKAIVIGNGCDIDQNDNFEIKTKPHDCIRAIFVGSPNQPWHGLNDIEALAKKLTEVEFHIVVKGFVSNLSNVKNYNGLYGQDLIDLYKTMHIGIGSMGLYKNGMSEASPLKTREYLRYGLPTIISYSDTDLGGLNQEDGILQIGNCEGSLYKSSEIVLDFMKKMKNKRVNKKTIYPLISNKIKEQKRLKIFSCSVSSLHSMMMLKTSL